MIPCITVWTGELYDLEYLTRLRAALPKDTSLMCLSDKVLDIPGISFMPIPHNLEGWWAKLITYSDYVPHPCLVVDLDIIWQDITPFFTLTDEAHPVTLREFHPGGIRKLTANTSIVQVPFPIPWVLDRFLSDKKGYSEKYPTEQHYLIGEGLHFNYYPSEWTVSYKWGAPNATHKAIIFHGVPKPKDVGWSIAWDTNHR